MVRSARKTNASWRSGARPRSAAGTWCTAFRGRARRACSGGSSSPRSARASSSASVSTQYQPGAARHPRFSGLCRVVWRRPASCAFFMGANFGEQHRGAAGQPAACAVYSRLRVELVTGGTGYVGNPPAAPPRGGGAARACAGPAAGAPAGHRRRARRPAHRRRPGGGARTAARPPTTSCTRWSPPRTATSRGATGAWPSPSARRRRAPGWSGSSTSAGSCRRTARCRRTFARASRSRRSCSRPCPASTALRASIVIGAGSSSFRLLVRLVERLRVLPMPRWRRNRTQPIDERDVIEFLARTAAGARGGGSLARRGRPRRDDLRPHDREDRRRDGRRAPAAGARPRRSRHPPARSWRP